MWTKNLQRKLIFFVVTLCGIVLITPVFLTNEFTSDASRNAEASSVFYINAATDSTDLSLWYIHFAGESGNVETSGGQKSPSVRWIPAVKHAPATITWSGILKTQDTLNVHIEIQSENGGTILSLTSHRQCGYFARLWKWILAWQESSLLEKNLMELENLVQQRAGQHVYYGFVVSETGIAQMPFAGFRAIIHEKDVFRYFSMQIQNLYSQCQKEGVQTPGRACLLRYTERLDNDSTEIFTGLPVPEYIQLAGTQRVILPGGTYVTTIAEGGETRIRMARTAIRKYMADRNLTLKMPFVEEYIHESADDTDPTTWKTKIYAAYK